MNTKFAFQVLAPVALLVTSSLVLAAPLIPVGEITGVTASKMQVLVNEAVTITVHGTVQPGKTCHLSGGPASLSPNFLDFGLVTLPATIAKSFSFAKPGKYYIHAYSGTTDAAHYCAVSTLPGDHRSVVVTVLGKTAYKPRPILDPNANSSSQAKPAAITPTLDSDKPLPPSIPPDPYRK